MPATCTFLPHQLSLLLLVGLHLFVGSSAPLASPSASSSQFSTAEPQGSAVTQGDASLAAASASLLASADPSSGSGRVRAPAAAEGGRTTSKPAIVSSQKAAESSNTVTETRTSSSPMHNIDTFSTLVSGEGRTSRVITNSISVSEEAIGTSASYTEMSRSGVLAQDSSSWIETKRADSSPRTVDITEPETVSLKVHSPKIAVFSLSEDNVTANGNTDRSWDTDSTVSGLPSERLGTSSATVKRHEERVSPFLMDKVTLTDSARTEPVSQTEATMSFDQTQFSSHATQSSGKNTTSSIIQFPNPSARVMLTHSSFSPNTAAEDSDQSRSSSSKTEKSIFTAHTDSSLVSGLSVRGGERTLRTLRNIRSSYNATQTSTMFSSEVSSYSGFTDSSYVLTPELTGGMNLSLGDTDSTEAALMPSQAPSETTVVEGNHQPSSNTNTEESISSSHSHSLPVSSPPDRSGERTLRTLRDISSSHNAAQTSTTSSSETSSSSDLTGSSYVLTPEQKVGMNLSLGDMYRYFTDTTLMHSQAPLETTDAGNSHNNFSNFSIGTRTAQTESIFSSPTLRSREGTLGSLTNRSKSTDAMEPSAFDLEEVSSSDLTQTSSMTAHSGRTSLSSTEMDFTESSEDPLLTYFSKSFVYSSSAKDLSRTGSSHQPVEVSDGEKRVSSASTDSVYLSTTFRHGVERTLRSLPDNSTSPDGSESSTSKMEVSESSDSALTLPSMADTEEYNISLSEVQSTEPSTQPLPEHSSLVPFYLTSPKDSSTIGNGRSSVSTSRTEASVSYTNSMYNSAPFSRREQTLLPIINTKFPEVTESTSSNMEKSEVSEQNPSSSEIYSRRTDFPVQDFDISVPSAETFQSLSSSRIPTYSSFQSEPSDTGTGYQSMSSTDTGKRISASHTDRTYVSTTFTRGGERTLLSISNNSTSESPTFYAEISSPSESVQSSFSVTQSRGSNMSSSDRNFSAPSTEPLAVHSLKTPGYSSAVSETTQLYSNSESTSATTLSFLPSSPTPPQQDSLPSTPPPVRFFSSASTLPPSSSPFPSPLPSSSQTTSMAFAPWLSSTIQPTLSPFVSLLPAQSSASSLLQSSESFGTHVSMAASERTTGIDLFIAQSSDSEYNNHTGTYPLKDSSGLRSTGPSSLLTETTEQLTDHSSVVTITLAETKTSREQNVSLPGIRVEKTVPILTTRPKYLLEGTTVSETSQATTSMFPSSTTQKDIFSLEEVTTREKLTKMTHTMTPLAAITDYSVTLKPPTVQPSSSTKVSQTSGTPTKEMERSSATNVKVTEHSISVTHPPKMFSPSQTTTFSTLPVPTNPTTVAWLGSPKTSPISHGKANVCATDTCLNNGKCILDGLTGKFQCQCSPGWQGEDCSSDIDECLSNPCPASATCTNTLGSFQCVCSLGYWMEKGKCNLVRTFVGQFLLKFNTTGGKYSELHHTEEVIINMLNNSLSTLPGYYNSSVKASRQPDTIQVSVLSTFSLASNVTLYEIVGTIQGHIRACKAPTETCQFINNLTLLYRGGGLCIHKDPECDKETSVCKDLDGIAVCQCKPGYFKYNKLDHSCRACEDGYKLENNTCVSCPFGLGGFNCGNPYQLITIVIAAAGGGLLLIMGIALIVTCCQKNKNDISKLIFKSGDFQMSPYAEYPKTPQAQDWGRETIEMQENGSTKNLLQMTDVYYMPTNVRNPELERNGVYPPYTGLPGSRHSCIYPGQYNPSFISDDSRRRDYF